MRVAFLSYDYGEYCIRLASALAGDAQVQLLLARQLAEPHLSRLNPAVDFRPFRKPRLRQPVAQIRNTWQLIRAIREFKPDVIHVQDGQLWFNLALPLLNNYPLVVTIHDVQHHFGDRDSLRRPQWMMDLAYRKADQVVVHAPQLREMVTARLGTAENAVHVVPHVILGDEISSEEQGAEGNVVLFFGRIWPYKGLEYLIRAEPSITARVPDARIVIAGEGEDFSRYRQMMANPEHFTVLNTFVPDEKRLELFCQAGVVVLPYVEASQSGVIPIAYSSGKPVVATTVGGLPAMVDDGVTGFLVPPCDSDALADAVVRLLRDPALRQEMGRNGKHKIESECSAEVLSKKLIAVYEQAIRQHSGPSAVHAHRYLGI